ncbi:zinc-finger domain-containing protein, partial [Bacillus thuringiensis]|nr:zinc-finger domain-containing protein [Bacillus thuringiensis]
MSPKEARMEILALTDNHCRQCDNKCSRDFVYCWTKCEVGKRLNEIGGVLHAHQLK